MKKTIALALLLLAIITSNQVLSQNGFKVGISMGPVYPIGEFKNADYQSLPAGFSQSGFNMSFDGDYYLIHRLAISARFNFGLSSMDKVSVADWLDAELSEYLSTNASNNLYSIDYWQWTAPMLGLKFNYPILINKLYVEAAAFSGLSIIHTPDQNLTIKDEENEYSVYSENIESTSYSIPIMVDFGLRYYASKNIHLKIYTSYFQSEANYERVNYIVKDNSTEVWKELGASKITLPIKTMSINLGIVYSINN